MNILDELQWRGLVADCTDTAALAKRLAEGPITLYCGFDPTADSLHVGNLVPLLQLRRFQLFGHHPIALAGGATGCIGDPSGKTHERQLLTREVLDHNISQIKRQLAALLDFEARANPARLLDNATWTQAVSYIDFLREVGKHFSVNQMIQKESVRARMEDREIGISYTEFSYMLLQAFDFCHLRREYHCELQVGATDQWGNITAGIDLCRKKLGAHVFGLTFPLMTKADGTKYGKTASGSIWLDAGKTSPYRFYQFFVQLDDRDVIKILKMLSFAPAETIADLEQQHAGNPGARAPHKFLAREMTALVHGPTAADDAVRASAILFGGGLEGITEKLFQDVVGEVPSREIDRGRFDGAGCPLIELLVESGLCPSKGQARKDVEGGGIYVNNVREIDSRRAIVPSGLLWGRYLLLRKGKSNYCVLSVR
ncbi:MAG TPA: tyrosine--tRNA ligase [Methylomirabilota bacterium]|nr:tyrosine--tRNA ligase [Methylomirabilota bacterium]